MAKLALNLAFIGTPCERVAAIVVSEMNERLSPKKAPPSSAATGRAAAMPLSPAISTARGVSATTVPTDVPTDSDMKQAATNSPGIMKSLGIKRSARLTVASIAPTADASEANAPARMKIHIMPMILVDPAARENSAMRIDSVSRRRPMATAHTLAATNDTDSGTT